MSAGHRSRSGARGQWRRALRDVRHLLAFRAATVRRRRAAGCALAAIGVVTVLAAVLPAGVRVDADLGRMLAPGLAGVVLVAVGAAAAGGGGRELIGRDAAAVHPISPVSDHLGALVLAPLSAGWLIQAWALLGLVAALSGVRAQGIAVAWVLMATALAQAVGWTAEWLRRRGPGWALGRFVLPVVVGLLAAPVAAVVGRIVRTGGPLSLLATAAALLALAVGLVVLGARAALATSRLVPRDEGRLESRTYALRTTPRSDLAVLRRIDRGSVWRSVPLRRGTWLLALAPGSIALAGGLSWSALVLMPGLVASGCVLLFGVNLWCLDGRGLLWRETLPVPPRTVVAARTWVLAELLLGAGAVTLLLGAVRAGRPTAAELLAVVLALGVVVGQAVSAGLRWSAAHPHAVDLRSARATPAPPLVMVGYSLRLAVATTVTGVLLGGLAEAGRTDLLLVLAAALGAVSAYRISRAGRRWSDPVRRARVVSIVSAG